MTCYRREATIRQALGNLACCTFIDRGETVLLLGPKGTRTRAAQYLREQAARAGYHSVFFSAITAPALNDALGAYPLVLVDDFVEDRAGRFREIVARARECDCALVICTEALTNLDEMLFDHVIDLDDRRQQTGGER